MVAQVVGWYRWEGVVAQVVAVGACGKGWWHEYVDVVPEWCSWDGLVAQVGRGRSRLAHVWRGSSTGRKEW